MTIPMLSIFLMSMPGGTEMILILVVVLLLFGGKKIPELMRGLGKGIKEFKTAKDSVSDEIEKGMQPADKATPSIKEIKPVL
ncbi:MAG TPA: twin-arginine translocase TatA/TatE family subunit [Ferruginibacter sp.]|nr:twin-arginine translocase TatA/TatE family subunit [Ferruginibacter sp.]